MRIFILEDDDARRSWFKSQFIGVSMDVTLNIDEAKKWLAENEYTHIFLDHDLSEEHYAVWREGSDKHDDTTGYAVAKFLAENPHLSPDAEIVVHSLNPAGSERMWRKMKETRRTVQRVNFLQLRQ